jgi:hypothetical protein
MITKGTEAYAQAQKVANKIQNYADMERWSNNSFFHIALEDLARFLSKVMDLDCFAAQIAKTVDNTINGHGFKVARCSSKQAWILACAAIENNIAF